MNFWKQAPLPRRHGAVLVQVVAWCSVFALVSLSACAADPGPPPLVEQEVAEQAEETTATSQAPTRVKRSEVQVGAEPLRGGLNPHLMADESSVVEALAKLALPSAFNDTERDPNVLAAASQLPTSPEQMTVRYVINDEAQWSDGTPLTGADFVYLWRAMTTTPGVEAPAAYQAIANIRVAGPSGKTVDVDFAVPVAQWEELFRHMLPSHLLAADASDFATALSDSIPASAGRFIVSKVDRGRGTIVLNRNDRFWGADPAQLDIVTVNAVRNTTQIADQLRSSQLAFVDKIPEETTSSVLGLLPETQVQLVNGPRTLGVTLSTTSPLLATREAREEVRSLIDVPLLARLAAGRSADLGIAENEPPSTQDPAVLPYLIEENRPLQIAADPADPEASAAARSLLDLLVQRGLDARVVSTDMGTITAEGLPSGDIDIVVNWEQDTTNASTAASRVVCTPEEYRSGNVSGLCTPDTQWLSHDILTGIIGPVDAIARVEEVLREEAVWVPLLHERRILALNSQIIGPSPDLADWIDGLGSAAEWSINTGAGPEELPHVAEEPEQ